jgi:inosine-uridine nucleoside N-ribohydrolase
VALPTLPDVVIDCDPGHDDAMAILLALRTTTVHAVTTVHGNAPQARTTENARAILALAGHSQIPVAAGADRPLRREPRYAPEVHGLTGLDGPEMPAPTVPVLDEHGADTLVRLSREVPGLQVIAVGPLTNVALAIQRDPAFASRIARITLMGGSLLWGNATPAAEFNILCDPEAAAIVFGAGAPITMIGLNVTMQVIATPERRAHIRAMGMPVAIAAADMLDHYGRGEARYSGLSGGAMHDPLAAAALVAPGLVETIPMHVAVVADGGLADGMTLCDGRGLDPVALRPRGRRHDEAQPNADVAVGVDVDGFWERFLGVLGSY